MDSITEDYTNNPKKMTPRRFIERLSESFLMTGGFAMALMMFATSYAVIRRYFFHSPEPYSYDITMICLLCTFVFSISAVERLDRHIRVDFISNRMPPRVQHVMLKIVSPLIGIIVTSALIWKGMDNALFSLSKSEVSTTVWALPLFPIKLMIPIGYSIFIIVLIAKIINGILLLKEGKIEQSE